MRRSEVYSWRISPEAREALELAARREGTTLARLLGRITDQWLKRRRHAARDDEEQERLHKAAAATIGTISGGDPKRSERARTAIRRRLRGGDGCRRAD